MVFLWHHLVVEGALPSFLELALAMSLACLDGCACAKALCLWRRIEVDVAWPCFLVALLWRRLAVGGGECDDLVVSSLKFFLVEHDP